MISKLRPNGKMGQAISSCKCHFHFGKEHNNLSSSMICDYQLCLVFLCPGTRSNAEQTDLSEILPEDVEEQVKAAAEISMGTEVTVYFCGNDLSFDYKIKKCSTKKKKIVRLIAADRATEGASSNIIRIIFKGNI